METKSGQSHPLSPRRRVPVRASHQDMDGAWEFLWQSEQKKLAQRCSKFRGTAENSLEDSVAIPATRSFA